MSDFKIGVIVVRNGLWHVEVEKHEYMMESPGPHQIKLIFGRDENRRVKVEILNSTNVRFLEFLR